MGNAEEAGRGRELISTGNDLIQRRDKEWVLHDCAGDGGEEGTRKGRQSGGHGGKTVVWRTRWRDSGEEM